MKNLLQKSLRPLTIFAFIVFLLSIPIYFLMVDWIWLKELDENNELIAQRIENEFNEQKISAEKLEESITFWNEIQSVGKLTPVVSPTQNNRFYTVRRQNPYAQQKAIDRFRGLETTIKINDSYFLLTIETNVEESEETVAYLAVVTLVFFLILVIGFWILNKRLTKKLWKPFHNTLQKLKAFNLNNQTEIQFLETDIIEFAELNSALDKLLRHTISVYKSQKEFTENASHELQTPLAIIKNKLDLLLQEETVTERQYQLVEELHRALTRITRINRNLLLLAKIENQQFDENETVDFSDVAQQSLQQLIEYSENKHIEIYSSIQSDVILKGNKTLMEILLNNLVMNAIKYSEQGEVVVALTKNQFTISNSGDKPLDSDKLFERFSAVSSATSSGGLGLAIIKEICNRHNWTVSYHFENNRHCFSIFFDR